MASGPIVLFELHLCEPVVSLLFAGPGEMLILVVEVSSLFYPYFGVGG